MRANTYQSQGSQAQRPAKARAAHLPVSTPQNKTQNKMGLCGSVCGCCPCRRCKQQPASASRMRGRTFSSLAGSANDTDDDASVGDVNLQSHPSVDDDEFGAEDTCCDVFGRHLKVAFCGKNSTLTVFLMFIAAVLALVGAILQLSFADQPSDSDSLTSLRVTIDDDKEAFMWSVLFAVAIALAIYPFARAANYVALGLLRYILFSKLVSVVLYIDAFDNGPLSIILWAVGANEVAVRLSGLPQLGALSTRLLVFFIVIGLVTGLKNLMLAILQGRAILDQFTSTVRQAVQRLVVLQNLSAAAVTVAAKRARLLAKFKAARRATNAPDQSDTESHIVRMDSSAVAVTVTGLDDSAPTLNDLAGNNEGKSAPELMHIAEQEERYRNTSVTSGSPSRGPVHSSPGMPAREASVASVALDSTAPSHDDLSTADATGLAAHSVRTNESGHFSQTSTGLRGQTSEASSSVVPGADLLTQHAVQLAVLRPDGLLSTVLQDENGQDMAPIDASRSSADAGSRAHGDLNSRGSPSPSTAARPGPIDTAVVSGLRGSPDHRPASEHHPDISAPIRDNLDAEMATPKHAEEVDAGDLRDFEDEEDSYYVLSSYIEQGEFSLFDGKGQIISVRNAAHAKKIVHGLFSALDVQNKGRIDREQLTWSGNGWHSPLGPGWSDESVEGAFAEIGADNAVSFSRADLLQFTEAAVDGFRSLHLTLSSYTAVTRALNMVSNVLLSIIFVIFFVVLFSFDVQPILISLGTVFVSLGFAISGPASNLVESLVFLLVTRPFELGDRVRFDKGDAMYVRRMDLYTTTFERLDGTIATYRNSLLASREVRNEKRSGFAVISPTIEVSMNITPAQVEALNAAVVAYVRDRPQSWRSGMIEFYIYSIQPERNSMTFSFWLKHRQPYQDCCAVFGDTGRFMLFLCGTLRELGLEYALPSQPVQISKAMDIGAGFSDASNDMRKRPAGGSGAPGPGTFPAAHPTGRPSQVFARPSSQLSQGPPAGSQPSFDNSSMGSVQEPHAVTPDDNLLDKVHQATSRWVDVKAGDIAQVWRPELQKFKASDVKEMQQEAPRGQLSLGLPALPQSSHPQPYASMLGDHQQGNGASSQPMRLHQSSIDGHSDNTILSPECRNSGSAGVVANPNEHANRPAAMPRSSSGPQPHTHQEHAQRSQSARGMDKLPSGGSRGTRGSDGVQVQHRATIAVPSQAAAAKSGKPIELSHSVPSFGGLTLKPLNQRQKHTRDKTLALQRQREADAKARRATPKPRQLVWGRDTASLGSQDKAGSQGVKPPPPSAADNGVAARDSDGDTVVSLPPAIAMRSRSWAASKRFGAARTKTQQSSAEAPAAFSRALASMDAQFNAADTDAGSAHAGDALAPAIGRTSSLNSLPAAAAGTGMHGSKSHDNLSALRD